MILDVLAVILAYFSGDMYGVNILFVTLFFNMFMVGLLVNMIIDCFLIKIGSGLMMLAGSEFTYKEIHDPINWKTINYINSMLNVLLVVMVCFIIERVKTLKNDDKRKNGTDN